jgi:DnaJ-class molecular chaperone
MECVKIIEEIPFWMREKTKQVRVVCKACQGEGLVESYEDNPLHDEPYIISCKCCHGSGTVFKIKTKRYEKIEDSKKI